MSCGLLDLSWTGRRDNELLGGILYCWYSNRALSLCLCVFVIQVTSSTTSVEPINSVFLDTFCLCCTSYVGRWKVGLLDTNIMHSKPCHLGGHELGPSIPTQICMFFFFFFCQKLNWNETGVLKLLAQVWDSLLEWILFHENYVSPLPPKRNWSWRYGCQQLELIVFPESDNPEHGYYQPSYISPKFSAHTSILITAFMKIGKCGVWGVFYDLLTFFFFDQIRLGKGEARFNTLG